MYIPKRSQKRSELDYRRTKENARDDTTLSAKLFHVDITAQKMEELPKLPYNIEKDPAFWQQNRPGKERQKGLVTRTTGTLLTRRKRGENDLSFSTFPKTLDFDVFYN